MVPSASVTCDGTDGSSYASKKGQHATSLFQVLVAKRTKTSAASLKINPALTSTPSPSSLNFGGLAAMECEAVTQVHKRPKCFSNLGQCV